MKSADEIIKSARYRTGNKDYTYDASTGNTTTGLATSVFVEVLNDAQDNLQSAMVKQWPNFFIEFTVIDLVSGTEAYELTTDVMFSSKIVSVQYTVNGDALYYQPLTAGDISDRRGYTGYPWRYFRIGKTIYINPIPDVSGAKMRVAFYRKLDDLDIKRATVSGTPSGSTITGTGSFVDDYELSQARYICISDADGNVMLRNGIISSYNTSTNVITLAAAVSTYLVSPYTLANLANGAITIGKNTTTISKLPDECERYMRVYTQKRIMTINESKTSFEEDDELRLIRSDILASFGDESRDVNPFPIYDHELMY